MGNYIIIGVVGILLVLVLNGLRIWFFAKDPNHHKKFHLRERHQDDEK